MSSVPDSMFFKCKICTDEFLQFSLSFDNNIVLYTECQSHDFCVPLACLVFFFIPEGLGLEKILQCDPKNIVNTDI